MKKPSQSFQKRQREMARKQKKEEMANQIEDAEETEDIMNSE